MSRAEQVSSNLSDSDMEHAERLPNSPMPSVREGLEHLGDENHDVAVENHSEPGLIWMSDLRWRQQRLSVRDCGCMTLLALLSTVALLLVAVSIMLLGSGGDPSESLPLEVSTLGYFEAPLPGLDARGLCNATTTQYADGTDATQSVRRQMREVNGRRPLLPASPLDTRVGVASPPLPPRLGRRHLQRHRRRLSSESEWARAHARVRPIVANMSLEEKTTLVRGVGWTNYALHDGFYIGSTRALPRLRVPSLNMQDGPQGFRTNDPRIVGSVTAWPCQLAIGAT